MLLFSVDHYLQMTMSFVSRHLELHRPTLEFPDRRSSAPVGRQVQTNGVGCRKEALREGDDGEDNNDVRRGPEKIKIGLI